MSQDKNEKKDYRERAYNWWLRYVLIPVSVSVIAGSFALMIAGIADEREREIAAMQLTRDFEIFATEVAANEIQEPSAGVPTEDIQEPEEEETPVPPTQTPTQSTQEGEETAAVVVTPWPSQPTYPQPSCGQVPIGWQLYLIRRGDTLYSLARRTGTTVAAIQQANCLYGSLIYAGQRIWLPPISVPVAVVVTRLPVVVPQPPKAVVEEPAEEPSTEPVLEESQEPSTEPPTGPSMERPTEPAPAVESPTEPAVEVPTESPTEEPTKVLTRYPGVD